RVVDDGDRRARGRVGREQLAGLRAGRLHLDVFRNARNTVVDQQVAIGDRVAFVPERLHAPALRGVIGIGRDVQGVDAGAQVRALGAAESVERRDAAEEDRRAVAGRVALVARDLQGKGVGIRADDAVAVVLIAAGDVVVAVDVDDAVAGRQVELFDRVVADRQKAAAGDAHIRRRRGVAPDFRVVGRGDV